MPEKQTGTNCFGLCSKLFSLVRKFPTLLSLTFTEVVKSSSTSKAIGYDNIPIRLVKDGISVLSGPLSTLFNSSITKNCCPSGWKYGQVSPIFKKDLKHLKSNYRPITVLVIFNNIFERILSNQLCKFFDNILSSNLSAYRKNFSCQTSSIRVVEELRIARDNGAIASVVGIDLSKAFDCLPHSLLLAKLKAYRLSEDSILLMESYLSNRFQRVKIGDTFSDRLRVVKSIPQGSVLGPLFLILS